MLGFGEHGTDPWLEFQESPVEACEKTGHLLRRDSCEDNTKRKDETFEKMSYGLGRR